MSTETILETNRAGKEARNYREQLARAMSHPENRLVLYPRGSCSAHAAFLAGDWSGARRMLLITMPQLLEPRTEELRQAGLKSRIVPVPNKRGVATNACGNACKYMGQEMLCYVMAGDLLAEAAHWHDAWSGEKPFDFIAVLEGELYANPLADRSLALKTVLDRAENWALLAELETVPAEIRKLESAWNARAVQVPSPAEP